MSSTAAARKNREFDPNTFLAMIGDARKILAVPKKQTIFTQGDEADAVFYVQKGKVKLTSWSKLARKPTLEYWVRGIFLGKGRLQARLFVWDSRVPWRTARF